MTVLDILMWEIFYTSPSLFFWYKWDRKTSQWKQTFIRNSDCMCTPNSTLLGVKLTPCLERNIFMTAGIMDTWNLPLPLRIKGMQLWLCMNNQNFILWFYIQNARFNGKVKICLSESDWAEECCSIPAPTVTWILFPTSSLEACPRKIISAPPALITPQPPHISAKVFAPKF